MAGTLAELGRLKRVASESGGRLDRLLANCIGAWLVSKRRITEEQNREVTTMTQAITEYERSLEGEAAARASRGYVPLGR